MVQLSVLDVLRECNGTLYCGNESYILKRFSKDTRTIEPNDVYLGIQGDTFDGNSFYPMAFEKGAECCILDHFDESVWHEGYRDKTIILVDDTVAAIQKLAAYKRSLIDIPVVAVTGSAGKTSTKDMIATILSEQYDVYKTPGNLNGQIGLPLSILELQEEEIMVLEMGMNDLGMISKLTEIAKPTLGVITNIGTAHIGILGSRENILKAKLEILEGMDPGSSLILNGNNDLLKTLDIPDYSLIFCGSSDQAEYCFCDLQFASSHSKFQVRYHGLEYYVEVPVMGSAFAMNSLLAIAVSDQLGVPKENIQKGLSKFHLEGDRMDVISGKHDITIINDTYNSNYEAIVNALDVLTHFSGTRKILVLGDVLEMESFGEDIHKKIGLLPNIKQVDFLFLVGENARFIKEGALAQGFLEEQIFYYLTKEEMEEHLLTMISAGDTVLLKASHGIRLYETVEKLKESFC